MARRPETRPPGERGSTGWQVARPQRPSHVVHLHLRLARPPEASAATSAPSQSCPPPRRCPPGRRGSSRGRAPCCCRPSRRRHPPAPPPRPVLPTRRPPLRPRRRLRLQSSSPRGPAPLAQLRMACGSHVLGLAKAAETAMRRPTCVILCPLTELDDGRSFRSAHISCNVPLCRSFSGAGSSFLRVADVGFLDQRVQGARRVALSLRWRWWSVARLR